MMAEENKSGPVTGAVVAVAVIAVASWFFNENMIAPRDGHVVAPASVSTVVGASSGSMPSGEQEYVLTGQIQVDESQPCTPGTSRFVEGRMVECTASVPQTTGGCWRNRRTGESVCDRTQEEGPPPVETTTPESAQAPSVSSQDLAGGPD